MSNSQILIVEDEILIADTIKKYLGNSNYQVTGIAISYEEAVCLYLDQQPDLILIDIRLSGSKTGIDLANFVLQQKRIVPFVYLTSQLDSLNLEKAKATFPAGYLTKPIQKETLYTTIEIALYNHQKKELTVPNIQLLDGDKIVKVPLKDILFLKADHVYVEFYLTGGRKLLQRATLKQLLDQLPKDKFAQTHRSYAVNLQHIEGWDTSDVYVQTHAIPVSRTRRKTLTPMLAKYFN